MDNLDYIDLHILQELQNDASQSSCDVAEKVHLSNSQCHRRIKRLEKLGYINGYVAILDKDKLNLNISAVVLVTINQDTPEAKKIFSDFVNCHDAIQECWTVVGERYAMLKVNTADMKTFSHFISNELMPLKHIATSESIVFMENIKSTTRLPLATAC